jgi:hypothetical protein
VSGSGAVGLTDARGDDAGAPHVGVPARPEQARKLYRRAYSEGSGEAAVHLGYVAMHAGENDTALEYFRRGLELGEASAHVGLGELVRCASACLPARLCRAVDISPGGPRMSERGGLTEGCCRR